VEQRGSNSFQGINVGVKREEIELAGVFERYRRAVPERRLAEMVKGQAAFSREGPLSAWVVIWLMIFQRLDAKGTLAVAVRQLLTGQIQAFVRKPEGAQTAHLSANTSAYSQARSKLPLEVAEKVSDMIFESLQEQPRILPGLERPLFLLDGTSMQLQHNKALVEQWPPSSNRHGTSHWPVMRVLVAHDVVSGLAVRPCWGPMQGPHAVSEQALTKEIIQRLPADCGVLGDRNFGIFSMAWHASQHNHPCLFRLTEVRAKKLNGPLVPPAGTDRKILWVPSREDLRTNQEISAESSVQGRLLSFRVRDARGVFHELFFFTTMALPADKILALYGYRWNIETDLRSLKREVRLHMLQAKSPAMVAKELLLAVAAYNLTRDAMNKAGSVLGLDPRQFSFSLAQDTLNAFLPVLANATNDQQRHLILQELLRVFSHSQLPKRNRTPYPRQVWPRTCPFPRRKSHSSIP
jgi:hypothetical protein